MNETYSEGDPLVFPNPPKTLLTVQTPPDAEYVVVRPPIQPGSDLGALVTLLARAGYIERDNLDAVSFSAEETAKAYVISHDQAGATYQVGYQPTPTITAHWELTLPQGIGYRGFLCKFYFDQAGALLHHGVWE